MRDKPVPAKELADSKRALVAGFALSLERPQRMLGYYSTAGARAAGGLLGHVSGTDHRRDAGEAQGAARKYWDLAACRSSRWATRRRSPR